jgi:hypothetical protein
MCICLPLLLLTVSTSLYTRLVLPIKHVFFAVLRLWQPLAGITAAWVCPSLVHLHPLGAIQRGRIAVFWYVGWQSCMIQVSRQDVWRGKVSQQRAIRSFTLIIPL